MPTVVPVRGSDDPKVVRTGGIDRRIAILTLLPLAVLVVLVFTCGVDIPFYDAWDFLPIIDKSLHHTLTFAELADADNGHRILMPRLIRLTLIHFNGWNIFHELLVNIVVEVGLFLVLAWQIRRTFSSFPRGRWIYALPVLSMIVFSLTQWLSWLDGGGIAIFLNVFAVVAGIVLLAQPNVRAWQVGVAAVLGLCAAYSFANGLLFWWIGLGLLAVGPDRKRMRGWAAAWGILSLAVWVGYLQGYRGAASAPGSHTNAAVRLAKYIAYVPTYLGGLPAAIQKPPLAPLGLVAGLCGLVIFVGLGWRLLRNNRVGYRAIAPYLALGSYSIASALLTAVARSSEFGYTQALASRYTTITMLLWISNLVFLRLSMEAATDSTPGLAKPTAQNLRRCYNVVVTVLLLGTLANVYSFYHFHRRLGECRDRLIAGETDYTKLTFMFPYPERFQERLDLLKKDHLSIYRDTQSAK